MKSPWIKDTHPAIHGDYVRAIYNKHIYSKIGKCLVDLEIRK